MVASSFWTEERLVILQERYFALDSCGEIARELGTSRNAVVSKARRLGLIRDEGEATRKRLAMLRVNAKERAKALRLVPALPEAKPTVGGEPVPYLARDMTSQCAAILDIPRDARGMPFVCGRAVVKNRPWCSEHFNRYIDLIRMDHGKTCHAHEYLRLRRC